MQLDYSYMETIFKVIEQGADIGDLKNNEGFRTISRHAQLTGNEFFIKDIENAIMGVDDTAYGLRNLITNLDRIEQLYKLFREQEETWLGEVVRHIDNLFDKANRKVTKLFPIIGYDIGIGLDNRVCINLNSEILLQDYKELISIIIHETAHTHYESIHGPFLRLLELKTGTDMMALLNNAIQYEGVGVFSAEEYRMFNNLAKTGSPLQEDYDISMGDACYMGLFREYKSLKEALESGAIKNSDEFISRCFNESRLTHRLGYAIFSGINRKKGIEGVREAIRMGNEEFAERFL